MKKITLIVALFATPIICKSQEVTLNIEPYAVVDTAEKFTIKVVAFEKDSMIIYYRLYNSVRTIEDGNKRVPKSMLYILAQSPIDTGMLNPVLINWGIRAKKEEEN